MMNNELRPYEKYKESKNPFSLMIPEGWQESRFHNIVKLKSICGNSNEELLSVYLNQGVIKYSDTSQKQVHKPSEDMSNYQLVEPGDLVMNNQQAWRGSVGVSKHRGVVSPAYYVFELSKSINSTYANYLFRESAMVSQYVTSSKGVGTIQRNLFYPYLKNAIVALPPRSEQDQIVKYLDHQLAKVNKFIKAKKKLIAVLKEQKQAIINKAVTKGLDSTVNMKPSEIEGIGDVPEHWIILMNRRIYKENCRTFSSNQETVLSLSQKEGIIPYEKMKERSLHTSSYENWKLVYENDLVLNRFKAHLGVFFSSELRGIVTFHYGVFEPIRKVESKYFEHLYHTNAFRAIYAGRSNGMTVGLQNLSNQNFYKVYTLLPPYDEQVQIVKFIEAEIEKSNLVISGIERELKLVLEFKTRIISDVVMGRADVRNVVIEDIAEEFLEEMEIDEDSLDEDIPLEEDGDE